MRSNITLYLFFYFPTRKYFTFYFKFLHYLRSVDRFKVLIWFIISEFYMALRRKFTKIVTFRRGGRSSTPCLDGVDFAHA